MGRIKAADVLIAGAADLVDLVGPASVLGHDQPDPRRRPDRRPGHQQEETADERG